MKMFVFIAIFTALHTQKGLNEKKNTLLSKKYHKMCRPLLDKEMYSVKDRFCMLF